MRVFSQITIPRHATCSFYGPSVVQETIGASCVPTMADQADRDAVSELSSFPTNISLTVLCKAMLKSENSRLLEAHTPP